MAIKLCKACDHYPCICPKNDLGTHYAFAQAKPIELTPADEENIVTLTNAIERHTCAKSIEFPDNTSTWVCSCGGQGTPYRNSDLVNCEFRQHRIANGVTT